MNHQYKTEPFQFTSEDANLLTEIKQEIISWGGHIEVSIGRPKRTQKQNRAVHAFFNDLSVELDGLGIPLSFGKGLEVGWTPTTAKEIFFKTLFLAGKGTSECSTEELAKAVDTCIRSINARGGQLSINEPIKGSRKLDKKML